MLFTRDVVADASLTSDTVAGLEVITVLQEG